MNKNVDITVFNPNCISLVLEARNQEIYSCKTTSEVLSKVKSILDENKIDTKASKRLLNNLQKSKSLVNSFSIVANSCLAGHGLSVI